MKLYPVSFAICVVLGAGASPGQAQLARPHFSADVALGGGARTQYANGIWFRGTQSPFGRVAIAAAAPISRRFRPTLTVERSGDVETGDHLTDCPLAPDRSCRRYFPRLTGYTVGVGIRAAVAPAIDIGIAGGTGSLAGRADYADVDLALSLTKHVRVLAEVRQLVVHHSSGERLWWRPLSAGLRIQ